MKYPVLALTLAAALLAGCASMYARPGPAWPMACWSAPTA